MLNFLYINTNKNKPNKCLRTYLALTKQPNTEAVMANSKLSNSTEQGQEQWEWIKGYEGIYEVSNHGRVRSYKNGSHGLREAPKILKATVSVKGYPTVALYKNKVKYSVGLHRVLAEAFIPNPNGYKLVLHHDDDKLNSSLSNLYWGTHKMNTADMIRNKGMEPMRGKAKLNETKVLEIRSIYDQGWATQKEIAKAYEVSKQTIGAVVRRETWFYI